MPELLRSRRVPVETRGGKSRYDGRMANDQILERIGRFQFPKGPVIAEHRNRGYSLFHANTGAPIARLRPFRSGDRFELLYWSSWKEKWAPTGPFGRTVLPLEQALGVIAKEGIFWTGARS